MDSPTDILLNLHQQVVEKSADVPHQSQDASWQSIAFKTNGQSLLINSQQVSEVVEVSTITLIPGVQPWVAGIANIHGLITPLIDLGLYLEGRASQTHAYCHVIAIERADMRFGLIVDQIVGMRQVIDVNRLETEPNENIESFLNTTVEIAGERWQVFDIEKFVSTHKFYQVAAA